MSMYTKKFLERLYFNLPPLVPDLVRKKIELAMGELESETASVEQVEDIIITFSKKIWSFAQAFEELVQKNLSHMGHSLVLQKASYALRRAIAHYQKTGGTWDALYTGAVASLFTAEERVELHQILVDINCDVREFTRQAVLTVERPHYEERVDYYTQRLSEIEHEIERLHILANSEHNEFLAQEIRQQIRGFELGIASIGPRVDYETVCNAHEHFVGRGRELRMRV